MFKVEEVPLASLSLDDRARKDVGDLSSLKHSIAEQGLLQPIVVNQEYKVLAGGRRYQACQELELSHVMCQIVPVNDKQSEFIIELAENASRKDFEWYEELALKAKIHSEFSKQAPTWSIRKTADKLGISSGGLSTDLVLHEAILSFPELAKQESKAKAKAAYKKLQDRAASINAMSELSEAEQESLKKMLKGSTSLEDIQDSGATKPAPVATVNGEQDLEELMRNCGAVEKSTQAPKELPPYTYDICDNLELIAKLPDNSVGFIEMDPPYAIDFNSNYGKVSNIKSSEDDWTVEKLYGWLEEALSKLYAKLIDNSWAILWTGKEHWMKCNEIAASAGFSVQSPGIWAKPSGSVNSPKTNMVSNYEMFLLLRKGNATFNIPSFPSVLNFAAPPSAQRTHQWEKPYDLYEYLFTAMGKAGSIFLSPFAGSGNSMLIGSKYKMTPIGADLKQKYCISFVRKFKDYHMKGIL